MNTKTMAFKLYAITYLHLANFLFLVNGEAQYALVFQNYKICTGLNNTKVSILKPRINRVKSDMYILTGTMIIHEDIPAPIYLGCYIEKCDDPNKPDSCKYAWKGEFPDLCEDLKDPKSKGYDFVNNTLNIPNPRCPLPQGRYKLQTQPLNVENKGDQVALMGPQKLWKMKLYFWEKAKDGTMIIHSCVYLESHCEKKPVKEKSYHWKR